MAYILYDGGKKVGEISDWTLTEKPPEKKVVLGKEILTRKPDDECTFTSPKPIHRKGNFSIIVDKKTELVLKTTWIKDGTFVTANVVERKKI